MKKEDKFQLELIEDLNDLFPGCMIFELDPVLYGQGIPDLLILYKNTWAALECKRWVSARRRPNQPWYIEKMNNMSFAAFIYSENREEIIHALCDSFGVGRSARILKSK